MNTTLLNTAKLLFLFLPTFMVAQNRYWVSFTDKIESLEQYKPTDFLNATSLQRRSEQGIEIQVNDYPVSPSYKNEILQMGYSIYRESRWLNAVSIQINETHNLKTIKELVFVKSVQKVKSYYREKVETIQNNFVLDESDYGPSFGQIAQLNGHLLHEQGFKGAGKTIAVIDASFFRVHTLTMFNSLWQNNQILDTWDFVLNQPLDYANDTIGSHGTMVLSCMGGYMVDSLIGTSPEASYLLYRTEDSSSETLTEEDNWVVAAEQADAFGADVINTSLGYSNLWDDLENTHTYDDMDGNTTVITIAGDIAASKGILVVNSAGNSGNSDWYYITAPADGDSVLTVGAVGADSLIASFSSHGPTADGRMKPNVVSQGLASVVCNIGGGIQTANGTSFSSPILAGMAATLWSALPQLSSMELYNLIQESAHLYPNGNNDYGYGIPDFASVLQYINLVESTKSQLAYYPNPISDFVVLDLAEFKQQELVNISIYTTIGKLIYSESIVPKSHTKLNLSSLPSNSIYILKANQKTKEFQCKLVK